MSSSTYSSDEDDLLNEEEEFVTNHIDEGSSGVVHSETIVVKESIPGAAPYLIIPIDTISEVSILKHLNQYHIQSELSYNPFPELYQVNVRTDRNGDVITILKMNHVGTSLGSIASNERMTVPQRCQLVNQYLDNILECIRIIHQNGVIHNDLHGDNIMIDPDDRVRIIDFGLAQLNGMSSSLEIFRLIPGETKNTITSDIWILASYLLKICLDDDLEYDIEWAIEDIYNHYPEVDYDELCHSIHAGDSSLAITIPNIIPSPLRDRLQVMLSINPNQRGYAITQLIQPVKITWDIEVNVIISNIFAYLLDNLLELFDLGSDDNIYCYNVTTAVSVLCRWFYLHRSSITTELALGVVTAIFLLSIDRYILDGDIHGYIGSKADINRIVEYQLTVLNMIDWRVFTYANTSYRGYDVAILIGGIKADTNRGRYFLMTDEELIERYSSNPMKVMSTGC